MHVRYAGMAAFALATSMLVACGGNSGSTGSSAAVASSSASSASSSLTVASSTCAALSLSGTDAQTLTGTSTPLQTAQYGIRDYSAPVLVSGLHDPKNYLKAPVLPTWQFATSDPTGGALSALECDVAPDTGWHSYARTSGTASTITHGKIVVTGGRNATRDHIYTVYNGQQLVAAINEAGLAPKIIRVVGHIDMRWRNNNTIFEEYTSYLDQKMGGSISIPSNTTLVGINDASGNPARITGTTILIGGELTNGGSDPQVDFENWIKAGKDGDQYPTWTRNVIIRNLRIDTPWDVNPEDSANAYADGVTISRTQNLWVDHISISDGDTPDSLASDTRHDGAIDIVRGSDYVTLSNSYIEKHHKTTLVGNGDSGRAWSDQGRLHTTFTGMWWAGTSSRLPLIRFGQAHLFNNYIEGSTTTSNADLKYESGTDVRYMSNVILESNYYSFTGLKPKEVCGKLVSGGTTKSALGYRSLGTHLFISDKDDNGKAWATVFTGPISIDLSCASETLAAPATADAWLPPYSYTAVSADVAYATIRANSGPGKIGLFNTAGTNRDSVYNSTSSSSSSSTASSVSSSTSSSAASSTSSASSSTSSSTSSSASSGSTLSTSWSETFDSASDASVFTTSYASLPSDASKPAYIKVSGTATVSSGVLTLTGGRLVIGALASDTSTNATTASSTPGGVFNVIGKSCSLVINASATGTGTGNFQVYVDNNTTSSSASPHGSGSRVFAAPATNIVAGTTNINWTLNDAAWSGSTGSFIMLRTESSTSVFINSFTFSCS